jgi:hypothetical protein
MRYLFLCIAIIYRCRFPHSAENSPIFCPCFS